MAAESFVRHHSSESPNVGNAERLVGGLAAATLLGYALKNRSLSGLLAGIFGGGLIYRSLTGRCLVYEALGISTADARPSATAVSAQAGVKLEQSIEIEATADNIYRHWRVLRNLPEAVGHLTSVTELNPRRSHWVAQTPIGTSVEWDAEIIEDRIGEIISWRSLPGSEVDTAGSVRFQPKAGEGKTIVSVALKYDPPGGKLAAHIAEFMGQGFDDALGDALQSVKERLESRPDSVLAAAERRETLENDFNDSPLK